MLLRAAVRITAAGGKVLDKEGWDVFAVLLEILGDVLGQG